MFCRRGRSSAPTVWRSVQSARRPVHLALTQNVHMDVVDRLSAFFIAVHYHPEPVFAAQLFGEPLGSEQDMPCQRLVLFGQVVEGTDRFFGDNQKMNRCLWSYIVKSEYLIIFIDDLCRYFTVDNLGKQGIQSSVSVSEVRSECTQQSELRPVALTGAIGFVHRGRYFSCHPS